MDVTREQCFKSVCMAAEARSRTKDGKTLNVYVRDEPLGIGTEPHQPLIALWDSSVTLCNLVNVCDCPIVSKRAST